MKVTQDHLGKDYPDEKTMCDAYGIAHTTFYQRYHVNNWTLEDSLTLPVRSRKPNKRDRNETITKNNHSKTEISKFSIQSNFPQKEYVRYLEHKIKVWESEKKNIKSVLTQELIDEKILSINNLKRKILADSFHYEIMDMIFAGKQELAKNMCAKATFEYCTFQLDNPSGMVEEIYVSFKNKFESMFDKMEQRGEK